jgi:hypothetical protein
MTRACRNELHERRHVVLVLTWNDMKPTEGGLVMCAYELGVEIQAARASRVYGNTATRYQHCDMPAPAYRIQKIRTVRTLFSQSMDAHQQRRCENVPILFG